MCCSSYSCAPERKPPPPPEPHPFRYSLFPVETPMPELFPVTGDNDITDDDTTELIVSTLARAFPNEVEKQIIFTFFGAAIEKATAMDKAGDLVWSAITWDRIDRQLSFWWRKWQIKRQWRCLQWILTLGVFGAPMRASRQGWVAWFQWALPGRDQAVDHAKAALWRLTERKLIRSCLHRSAGRILNVYEPLPALVEALNAAAL